VDLVSAIEEYYRRNHIEPATYREFGCPDKKLCRVGCDRLTTGKEPLIGSKYERRLKPRLLIISAEPAEGARRIADRHVARRPGWERVEADMMNGRTGELHPRSHWYKTAQLGIWIFEVITTQKLSRWVWKKNHKREFKSWASYWAHTNSGKCSQNRDGHQQASPQLFKNCRKYLGREIRILDPDIIVTQGKPARTAVEAAIRWKEIEAEGNKLSSRNGSCNVLRLADHPVLWIAMPHPNSHNDLYYEQIRTRLPYWANRIKAFLAESGWGLRDKFAL
jgi:hypothetical protein